MLGQCSRELEGEQHGLPQWQPLGLVLYHGGRLNQAVLCKLDCIVGANVRQREVLQRAIGVKVAKAHADLE